MSDFNHNANVFGKDPAELNDPLPDQGPTDGEHGEGLEEPEEHPGVGN
jgi:hypothetical protein